MTRLMMGKIGLTLLLGLGWWAPAAWAVVLTVDDIYNIDVPRNWTYTQLEPGYTIYISPDKKAVFLITSGLSDPIHRKKVAAMVEKYKDLREGTPERLATVMRVRDKRVVVTIIGDHPDRVKLYYSIKAVPGDKMKEQWLSGQ